MWKKLLYLAFIIWMAKPIQSAVIECYWGPDMQYCNPHNITPVTQPNEVITINGQPSNYVNPNTADAWFYNQVINYIPTGLFTLFPNLRSISIENCGMTTITTDSIPNCGVLSSFFLRGGTFTSIPAGFLESCKSLTFLGIVENNVTTVDVDAFRGLTNVISLSISYSKVSCIPLGLFQHTPNLVNLDFMNNMITSIDSNLFANLPALNNIYLSQNLITYVPMLNFTKSTDQYFSIDFGSNPIYALPPDFCSIIETNSTNYQFGVSLYNVSCIPMNSPASWISSSTCQNYSAELQSCYSNWTSSMNTPVPCGVQPPTTLAPTTTIAITPSPTSGSCPSDKICRYFLDQYNRYTCILDGADSVLTSISGNHLITFADVNVRRVVFTNSFLSRIPPILFQKFTSLEYLTVSNCSISSINTNTFTACGNLKYFDASDNFITTVDGASFKSCAALEVIDFTGNKFDFISGQLFVNNPTLKAVYINRPPAMVLV